MWQALVSGIQAILTFFYNATVSLSIPSYALAIILFTLLIKLILFPLTYKQMYSMKKMQEIQPEIKALQEKNKKNPEKANKEVMALYQTRGVNPMAGCLPLLIQMPILIALYQAISKFQYSDLGAGLLWIPHLKNPDPYYIIPILVAVTTFFQTKLTTPDTGGDSAASSTNKMMLYFMPLFIGYVSLNFPSGLGIYWIFFSLFGTLQQLYINRRPDMKKGEVEGQ